MEDRSSETRTPAEAVAGVIGVVLQLYLALNPAKTREDFFVHLGLMGADGVTGDGLISTLDGEQDSEEISYAMRICMAFSIQSYKAFREGRGGEAWSYAFDAAMWLGNVMAHAQSILISGQCRALSENARKAALARHAENHEISNQIMEWFKENHGSYRSLDSAAEAATKLAPTSFRTARKWVGEANKKLALQAGRKSSKKK